MQLSSHIISNICNNFILCKSLYTIIKRQFPRQRLRKCYLSSVGGFWNRFYKSKYLKLSTKRLQNSNSYRTGQEGVGIKLGWQRASSTALIRIAKPSKNHWIELTFGLIAYTQDSRTFYRFARYEWRNHWSHFF